MGVVYRARDTLLDRDVAVKVLSAATLGTQGRARLLREAQAVAQLDHPNIVAVFDAGESDGAPFIVMQLVEGRSLRDRPPQTLDEVLSVARQLCAALEHSHAHGIVHRDLKPENVIVETSTPPSPLVGEGPGVRAESGLGVRVKLMDFGLARSAVSASRLTAEGALVGTALYLAPEQALGQEVDARADLYALGVVLYELVAGRLPFAGDDLVTIITQHLHAPVVPPGRYRADLPPGLEAIILRLLEKRPADRFASAQEVLVALAEMEAPAKPAAVGERRDNLPLELTSFVGREREMGEVKRLLSGSRLVALTGAGGCGKTRLAMRVAAQVVHEYADGVWLVALASLADPNLVPQAVATTLGVPEQPGRTLTETLSSHLRGKEMLLVLDSCEHLIVGCAQLAESLLQACPDLRLLATSQEGLGLTGEVTFSVPSLPAPDAGRPLPPDTLMQYDAVRLFVDRARAVQPGFALTQQSAAAVGQVCRRLDGIPLAIELAAARVKMLQVEQIAGRLDDRFGLLTSGSRTALPRHRTLRATVDWSYDLLPEAERALLRRLSVFARGWSLEAAEYVASDRAPGDQVSGIKGEVPDGDLILDTLQRGTSPASRHLPLVSSDVLDLLSQLVNKSLVIVAADGGQGAEPARGGEARYHMLETIRQYAGEKLVEAGEHVATCNRHFDYFLSLAEQAQRGAGGPELKWMDRTEIEHENLRAALDWGQAAEGKAQACLRLASALAWFWTVRGYLSEGRERLSAVLSSADPHERTAVRASAFEGAAELAYWQSDLSAARSLFEESLAIYRQLGSAGRQGVAMALMGLGDVATDVGDYVTARSLLEEALAIMQEQKDVIGSARVLTTLGWAMMAPGEYAAAEARLEQGLALFREMDDRRGIGQGLAALGEAAGRQGQYDRATRLVVDSLALRRAMGDKWGIAASLGGLAWIALRQGDFERARALLAESLALRRDIGDKGGMAWCLEREAEMAAAEAQAQRAVRLLGAAAFLRAGGDAVMETGDQPEHERQLAALRDRLGDAAFAAAWAEGRAMTLDQAKAYALEETQA